MMTFKTHRRPCGNFCVVVYRDGTDVLVRSTLTRMGAVWLGWRQSRKIK